MRGDEGPIMQQTQRTTPRLKRRRRPKIKGGNIGRTKEENPMLKANKPFRKRQNQIRMRKNKRCHP
jgi:hypothetical protein